MSKISERERFLEIENAALKREIQRMHTDPGDPPMRGCGDSRCVVLKGDGGMATNGGCQCTVSTLVRAVLWWRRVAEFRQITIRDMRADAANTQEG